MAAAMNAWWVFMLSHAGARWLVKVRFNPDATVLAVRANLVEEVKLVEIAPKCPPGEVLLTALERFVAEQRDYVLWSMQRMAAA